MIITKLKLNNNNNNNSHCIRVHVEASTKTQSHALHVESNLSLDIMLYNCCVSIVFVLLISNTHRNWLTASTCALIIDLQFVLIKCKFL